MRTLYRIFPLLAYALVAAAFWPVTASGQIILDLRTEGATADHNGARFIQEDASEGAGTGILDPFYRVKSNSGTVQGYNTGSPDVQFETEKGPWTEALLLSTVTDREVDGLGIFKEFLLDINQTAGNAEYAMVDVQVFEDDQPDLDCMTSVAPGSLATWGTCDTGTLADEIFWLDKPNEISFPGETGNASVVMNYSLESGSGNQTDITMLIPYSAFTVGEECEYGKPSASEVEGGCDTWVYVYSRFGIDERDTIDFSPNDDGFEEWSTMVKPFVNIDKTLAGSIDEVHDWTLTKDVDSAVCDAFIGGSCVFNYDVNVVETESRTVSIGGVVTYSVPATLPDGDQAALDAEVSVTDDFYSDADGTIVWSDPSCAPGSLPFTIGAGDSKLCPYTITFADESLADGGTQSNTVTAWVAISEVTVEASFEAIIAENVSGPAEVDLSDTIQGDYGLISSSFLWEYTRELACSENLADYAGDGFNTQAFPNTASITDGLVLIDDDSESVTVNCYAPVVSKTANASYTDEYAWTIEKSVSPEVHNLFAGETAGSDYDVNVVLEHNTYGYAVSGVITVQNPAPMAMLVDVADVLDDGTPVLLACGGSLNVPAASSADCGYSATPAGATATLNTATVSLEGFDFPATAPVTFAVNIIGEPEVNVDDTYAGDLGSATGTDLFEYSRDFVCSSDPADYLIGSYSDTFDNTATILETEQSDDASVTLNCYAPVVSKDASTYKTRTWEWTITKSVTPELHQLFIGDSGTSDYSIVLDKTGFLDSGFIVDGTITVVNHHPTDAMVVSLADLLNDGTVATLDCGGSLEVPANGGSATCDYEAMPIGETATLNTATATLNAIAFASTAPVDFAGATIVHVDDEVNVTDDLDIDDVIDETYGPFTDDETIPYSREFGCSADPADYTDGAYSYVKENRAAIVETLESDDASVTVECYMPSVSKNAFSSLTRTHEWSIVKSVTPDAHQLFAGGSAISDYTVTVTNTGTVDSDWLVFGSISVTNPHPAAQLVVALEDALDDGTVATLDECSSPLVVAAGATVVCGYTADPLAGTATQNTVTFTLNEIEFSASSAFDFEAGTITELFGEVNVTDAFDGGGPVSLGDPVLAGGAPAVFEYPRPFECSSDIADYTEGMYGDAFANTATIVETEQSDDASVSLECYAPLVSKTAETSRVRTYDWTIDKLVDPAEHNLFIGDDDDSEYTVTVTKTLASEAYGVTGMITIANPAPMDMDILLADVINGLSVDVGACAATTVPLEDAIECPYSAVLPGNDDLTNTATVTIVDTDAEFTGTADVIFNGEGVSETNPSVFVDDDNDAFVTDMNGADPGEWTFTSTIALDLESWPVGYTGNFACGEELEYVDGIAQYTHPNTATIVGGDSDDALVTVNCYRPSIAKDASSSLTRTHEWSIVKSVTPEAHQLFAGGSAISDYTVTVTNTGSVDSDWRVFGTISVTNPHPTADLVVALEDALDDGTVAALECENPLTIAAGASADCAYEAVPLDGSATENTVTFLLNGISFGDSFTFDFEAGTITELFGEVNVTDAFDGADPVSLGDPVLAGGEPAVFEYPRPFECSSDIADYTEGMYGDAFANTATIVETEQSDDASVSLECYAPLVSKTAETSRVRTYDWTIDKLVDPEAHALFAGDTAESQYTLTVSKDLLSEEYGVMGVVTIHNPAPMDLLVAVQDMLGGEVVDLGACDDDNAGIAAGESLECPYSTAVPTNEQTTNEVSVTIVATEAVFTASADVVFNGGTDVSELNPEVFVDDTSVFAADANGEAAGKWTFASDITLDSESWPVQYLGTFDCDDVEYTDGHGSFEVPNTATIVGGDSDDALVTVDCYELAIDKTASSSFTRDWTWEIAKSADAGGADPDILNRPEAVMLAEGQSYLGVAYVVSATASSLDSDFLVTGEITIDNPHPTRAAELDGVTDLLTGDLAATVDCPAMEVPAGGSLVCAYEVDLPDGEARTNTATALNRNYHFGFGADPVVLGSTPYEVALAVAFDLEVPTVETDECADVGDSWFGDDPLTAAVETALGTICASDLSASDPYLFPYGMNIIPEGVSVPDTGTPFVTPECGENTFPNWASLITNDNAETAQAPWFVDVNVVCDFGCTLTQGYWKTHSEYGPAPYDENWANLESGADTELFGSGMSWHEVFWTAPAGNAWYNLAHQWMAAYLNTLNGASTPDEVEAALADGEALLAMGPDAFIAPKGGGKKSPEGQGSMELIAQAREVAGLLAMYNEGYIGPGHCDEDDLSDPETYTNAGMVSISSDDLSEVTEAEADIKAGSTEADVVDTESGINEANAADAAPAEAIELPTEFTVGNYPNPFNPTTTIQVAVPEASRVRVSVYDLLGRMVSLLVDGQLSAGTHSVTFDAGSLPSGVYLYRLEYSGGAVTRTMQLLK